MPLPGPARPSPCCTNRPPTCLSAKQQCNLVSRVDQEHQCCSAASEQHMASLAGEEGGSCGTHPTFHPTPQPPLQTLNILHKPHKPDRKHSSLSMGIEPEPRGVQTQIA